MNPAFDTRNLVEALIYIIVVDVQDTPPIFSIAPAVTTISNTLDIVRYLFINILILLKKNRNVFSIKAIIQ